NAALSADADVPCQVPRSVALAGSRDVGRIRYRKRATGAEENHPGKLPATQQVACQTRVLAQNRQLIKRVQVEHVRPVPFKGRSRELSCVIRRRDVIQPLGKRVAEAEPEAGTETAVHAQLK